MLLAALAFSACAPDETTPTALLSLTDTAPAATQTETVTPAEMRASTRKSTPEPMLKVVNIVAGEGHSCALLSDGTIKCWGKNEFGQLGFGKTGDRGIPVLVRDLRDAVQLTAGWGHTCALNRRNAVLCWGYGRNGELGNNKNENSALPVFVFMNSEGIRHIAAGDDHTCAALENGEVLCWGFNETGQLGDGTTGNARVPVKVTGLPGKALALAAGWGHTCALMEEGGVYCWGDNTNGQLGNGSGEAFIPSPKAVSGLAKGVAAITAKGGHTCALLDAGTVKCWGDNSYGQLGDGTAEDRKTPETVARLEGVRSVAAGWNHTCAIIDGEEMKCWGWNYFGQLGDRSMTSQLKPVSVAELPGPASAMGLGWRHTCAVIDPGLVMCWGANEYGQGWDGWLVEPDSPTPTADPGADKTATPTKKPATPTEKSAPPRDLNFDYQPMDSGGNHNCAITKKGGVKCWGSNDAGQMGIGNSGGQSNPVDVIGLTGEAVGVAVGGSHSCAVMRSGDVMCWGANYSGEIGDGTHIDRKHPALVLGLPNGATSIAAGGGHTCAVVPEGVMCWGANNNHQLGTPLSGPYLGISAVYVKGLSSGVRELSSISDHTCALTRAGGVVCWGLNEDGQLGDGTKQYRPEAVPVSGLESGVMSVAAGHSHSCAVTLDGKVKCWGANAYGTLGDGAWYSSFLPVDVLQGDDKAVRVVAGFYHACYLTDTGKVKCWGLGNQGQLGNGSFSQKDIPLEVWLSEKVLFLEAGDTHTCAITVGGSIVCWGSNFNGQLGNGETTSSNVPVEVIM